MCGFRRHQLLDEGGGDQVTRTPARAVVRYDARVAVDLELELVDNTAQDAELRVAGSELADPPFHLCRV